MYIEFDVALYWSFSSRVAVMVMVPIPFTVAVAVVVYFPSAPRTGVVTSPMVTFVES